MLSNKLTFFLASLIVLLMASLCLGVAAQAQTKVPLAAPTTILIPAHSHLVFTKLSISVIEDAGISGTRNVLPFPNIPNLEAFFRAGGTLELIVKTQDADSFAVDVDLDPGPGTRAPTAKDLVISEIMWGLDNGLEDPTAKQWIEIYNTTAFDIGMSDEAATATETTAGAVRAEFVFTPFTPNTEAAGDNAFVSDSVTNVGVGGKTDLPGQSGVSVRGATLNSPPQSNLISAYRDINYAQVIGTHKLNVDNTVDTAANRAEQLKGVENKGFKATPVAGSRNMLLWHIGTPGVPHVSDTDFSFDVPVTSIPSNSVVINEVHNDPENDSLDWVELYNAGSEAVGLRDWELSVIKGDDPAKTDVRLIGKDSGDDDSKRFPKNEDFKLKPGAYLLIVNRHPRETILANGVNIDAVIADADVKAGAEHQYIVRESLVLPNEAITLILRSSLDKNSRQDGDNTGRNYATSKAPSEAIVDFAGNHGIAVASSVYNTNFWPFRGWDRQSAARGKDGAGIPNDVGKTWSRKRYQANDGHHKDAWEGVGAKGGLGYDPGVDLRSAPGTPGYANNALVTQLVDDKGTRATTDDVAFAGSISISEVMVDAGPRWNLVQWIELYNSSMTEAINLKDWELEVRNAADDVESYVDSSFTFNDAYILPNQTLLLVSGTGTNDVAVNRVYNLYRHHRRELGLTSRRSVLLSPEGFYLKLSHRDPARPSARDAMITVDEVGNVKVDGAAREVMWELPARNPEVRQSLVRQYGTRELYDGTPDLADDGTMAESWRQSDLVGAGISFYGHRDDVSTPGYRLGGPLPVELSSFRPVRNQATGHVDITWVTQSELNNAGFNILRSETKTGEYKVINVKGIIAGHGTTSEKHVYTFTDTTAKPNVVYYYQIEDVSLNGNRTPLRTTHLRGNVSAGGKLTTTWGDLKSQQ